jgi:23S rRNA pseudouridine1911/1915/1917 synthase
VHRLDQGTSGVMLFVYNEKAQGHMKKQFEEHSIVRIYLGLIEGNLPSPSGTWESNLREDDAYFVRSSPHGEKAITHYEVVAKRKKSSLVRFALETGKKNQIRVHTSEAGHPIVGDKKYGAKTNPYKRLCLHAHFLSFEHPATGKRLAFTSPLPSFGGA